AATPATIGLPWASDNTLTVYGGTGGGTLFGGGANPGRTFAGILHYTASDSLVWSDGVNILGHADTLVVSPLTTTTYTCTIIDDNCSFTDTIVVNVGQQLPDIGI